MAGHETPATLHEIYDPAPRLCRRTERPLVAPLRIVIGHHAPPQRIDHHDVNLTAVEEPRLNIVRAVRLMSRIAEHLRHSGSGPVWSHEVMGVVGAACNDSDAAHREVAALVWPTPSTEAGRGRWAITEPTTPPSTTMFWPVT